MGHSATTAWHCSTCYISRLLDNTFHKCAVLHVILGVTSPRAIFPNPVNRVSISKRGAPLSGARKIFDGHQVMMIAIVDVKERGLGRYHQFQQRLRRTAPLTPNKFMTHYTQCLQRGSIEWRPSAHPELKRLQQQKQILFSMPSILAMDSLPLHHLAVGPTLVQWNLENRVSPHSFPAKTSVVTVVLFGLIF